MPLKGALYALAVKLLVGVLEPAQGWFVLAAEAVVKVDNGIVILHMLVQRVLQIPEGHKTQGSFRTITRSTL